MTLRSIRGWQGGLLLLVAAWAAWFYYRQNHAAQIGGPISPPKILWLAYAVAAWFVVPFFLWRDARLEPGVRRLFGVFWTVMFARGAIEMALLYVVVHWNPIYGISHDLLCIFLLLWFRRGLAPSDALNRRALRYGEMLVVALIAEIAFAGMFLQTKVFQGAVYFASTEASWAHINRVTTCVLFFVYPDFVLLLSGLFFPGVRWAFPRWLRTARLAAAWGTACVAVTGLAYWTWIQPREISG